VLKLRCVVIEHVFLLKMCVLLLSMLLGIVKFGCGSVVFALFNLFHHRGKEMNKKRWDVMSSRVAN